MPDGLFLQNHHTEASFPQIFSKLRNSRTTYIEKSISALPINHGVYIDIFPLDEYPADRGAQRRLEFEKQRLFLKLSVVYCSKKTGRAALYQHLNRLFHYDRHVHEKCREAREGADLQQWTALRHSLQPRQLAGSLEYAPREQYGDGAWADFEGLRVRVPEKYDDYLTQKYGDWRADLPPEEQVGTSLC